MTRIIDPFSARRFILPGGASGGASVPSPLFAFDARDFLAGSGGNATLANTDPVAEWVSSGVVYHAAQATAGNKPLFQTNVWGSLPAVAFDGTDDFLDFTDTIADPTGPSSVMLVLEIGAFSNANIKIPLGLPHVYFNCLDVGDNVIWSQAGGITISLGGFPLNTKVVLGFHRRNGDMSGWTFDSDHTASGTNAGDGSVVGFTNWGIGAKQGGAGSSCCQCKVGYIAVWEPALTPVQAAAAYTSLYV